MKHWTVALLLVGMMVPAGLVHAQFSIAIYQDVPASPLMTTCGGSTPLPDGTIVKIFHDADSDGPDATDPQPAVCADPPECTTPFGAANYDQFAMNGVAEGMGAGYFFTSPQFVVNHAMPVPPLYYLRIYEADGITTLWTSDVITMIPGPQEYYMTDADWTCGPSGPQCTVIDEAE